MSRNKVLWRILFSALFVMSCNSYIIITQNKFLIFAAAAAFLAVNILPGFVSRRVRDVRLSFCSHGAECLLIFLISAAVSAAFHIAALIIYFSDYKSVIFSALVCIGAHFILFWNGIISVYCTSVQLGIKQRAIGALCGLIPVVNLFVLGKIIRITLKEVELESKKEELNRARRDLRICATKYPILLVHGVFFRDYKYINYWGRIPRQLILNGASVFYGNHQSALSVKDSAKELSARVREIVFESGCQKVNIIAHSKGGLDCRYMLANQDCSQYVASLTTINTPHRGCGFADYLLGKIPASVQNKIASTYNKSALKLGDSSPDFMAAVQDLTARRCIEFDRMYKAPKGIFCQSVGSVLKRASHGKFPLNFSFHLVKYFDGENDGLVSEKSFAFGEKYTLLKVNGSRGISHGDVVDLNRENIPGFDVREFYVQLVSDLKKRGL